MGIPHLQLERLQVGKAALVGEDHVGVLAAVVCPQLGLGARIAVAGKLRTPQAWLAGDDLGVLALGADDGHVRRLVLHSVEGLSTAIKCQQS